MNPKTIEKFKAFLITRGAELLIPTNEWELLRFKIAGRVSVLYRDKRGNQTFTNDGENALKAFKSNKPWVVEGKIKPIRNKPSVEVRTLLERDGDRCFYCLGEMTPEQISKEHLLSRAHGGSNHISNLVLCHIACNNEAGHLSVMEKIKIREQAVLA